VIGELRQELSLWSCKLRAGLSPGAQSIGRLARKYLESGQLEDSSRVLQEGMKKYPGLSELEDVAHFVSQLLLRQQELRMQEVLHSARSAYCQLAQAHISVGDLKAATETIWSGLQRFPDCAPLYRCLGELHLRLFLEDFLPHDGTVAAENLERALGLDDTDTQARAYLAGLYCRVGCYSRAARHLHNLLDRMSSNEKDYALVERLLVQCNHRAQQPADGQLLQHLNAVHENRGFVEDLGNWAWPESPGLANRDVSLVEVQPELVTRTVSDFLPKSRAKGAVVLTQSQEQIIGEVPFAHSPETLPGILRALTDTGLDSCHRMELGHSRRATVQLSGGSLGFLRLRNAEVVFLFGSDHATKSVGQTMDHFTDCLATAIGEAGEDHTGAAE
jgi:tetratricopeptide (TPR) repeat protein